MLLIRYVLDFIKRRKMEIAIGVAVALPLAFLAEWIIGYYSESHRERVLQNQLKAVVVISVYDNLGHVLNQASGFLVRRDGAVVTCLHNLVNAAEVKVKVGKDILDTQGILYIDKDYDVAILSIKGNRLPALKIAEVREKDVGKKIYVIGNPLGLEKSISDGLLSGMPASGSRKALQITAPISPGSSGSPVFNESGGVIGIVASSYYMGQNVNFAVPAAVIKGKIETSTKVTPLRDSGLQELTNTPQFWINIGLNDLNFGRYPAAADAFRRALRYDPDNEEAHFQLGYSLGAMGKLEEAVVSYKEALKHKPDDKDAHYWLGRTYLLLKNYPEAISSFKNTLGDNPDGSDAHFYLGVAYGDAGRYREAVEVYKKVLQYKPRDQVTHFNLGVNYKMLNMDKEAIEEFKAATDSRKDYAPAYYQLGLIYLKLGMNKEAVEAFNQAAKHEPTQPYVHYYLGLSYEKLNMYGEAVQSFENAIKYRPDYPDAQYELAIVYLLRGDAQSALKQHASLKQTDSKLAAKLYREITKSKERRHQ